MEPGAVAAAVRCGDELLLEVQLPATGESCRENKMGAARVLPRAWRLLEIVSLPAPAASSLLT